MSQVAYKIKDAAVCVSVGRAVIVTAIQDGELSARRVGGNLIILRGDLKEWAKSQPDYLRTMGRMPESMTR